MAERYFTPLVRQLAASLGVDLTGVQGTGVGGRVRSDDVRAAAGVRASSAPRAASGSAGWSPAAYTYDEWRGWQNPDHPLVTWAYETNRIFASSKTGFNQMMASNPAAGARELLAREQIVGLEGRDRPPPRGYTNPPAPSAAERAADDLAFHAFTASIAGETQADTALDARVTQAERQRRVRDLYESGDL